MATYLMCMWFHFRFARVSFMTLAGLAVALPTAAPRAQGLPALEPLDATGRVTYSIAEGLEGSRFRTGDRDLATWALQAWERAVGGALRFELAPESDAIVQVHWVPAGAGQYGEMRPVVVNGRRGAAVYIRPDTDALGPDIAQMAAADPLLRDAIVYLTCVHELGHALGLSHTANFADIMYSFGYGGDIPAFFGRYRALIRTRTEIAGQSGLSAGDLAAIRSRYGAP